MNMQQFFGKIDNYWHQFYQHFTSMFFVQNFGAKKSNPKCSFGIFAAKILYRKRSRKALMKLTAGRIGQAMWSYSARHV